MSQMENMNQERDGLRYPSIDELTDKSSSKYKLVIAAAKRANEMHSIFFLLFDKFLRRFPSINHLNFISNNLF